MPEDKIPINAKIPPSLHSLLVNAVTTGKFKDKTDCITQALEIILNNTHQETDNLENVLQEKENEILILREDIQNNLLKINELQRVIRGLPDPVEIAEVRARESVLHLLLEEKDKRIEDLNQNLRDLRIVAYKPVSREQKTISESRNTHVIQRNTAAGERIKKVCKNCGESFEAGNSRKETCSDRCRSAYSRTKKRTT